MTDDPSQLEEYKKNTKEQYEALGRFVEAFERLVNHIRNDCVMILTRTGAEHTMMNIVMHHNALTAKPLFDIFQALVGHIANTEDERKSRGIDANQISPIMGAMRTLANTMEFLTKTRNALLHGTWYVGFVRPDDLSADTFMVHKSSPSKRGLSVLDDLPRTAEQLKALRNICAEAEQWVITINSCIAFSSIGIAATGQFKHNGKEWVRVTKHGEMPLPDKLPEPLP